eukprot:3799791-Rhodomonas_salina.1
MQPIKCAQATLRVRGHHATSLRRAIELELTLRGVLGSPGRTMCSYARRQRADQAALLTHPALLLLQLPPHAARRRDRDRERERDKRQRETKRARGTETGAEREREGERERDKCAVSTAQTTKPAKTSAEKQGTPTFAWRCAGSSWTGNLHSRTVSCDGSPLPCWPAAPARRRICPAAPRVA